MKEYSNYLELDTFRGNMLHENAIALNCGRAALKYVCEAKKILENHRYHIFFVHL